MSLIVEFLIRWRYLSLAVALAAGGWGAWCGQHLKFDRSIENMFSADDPVLTPYEQLKRTFGGNEIVLAVYDDDQLMTAGGMERLAKVRAKLEAVKGVKSVLSLDRPLGPSIIEDNPIARHTRRLFEGYTHSRDGKMAALGCMLKPRSVTQTTRVETIRQLRAALSEMPAGAGPGMLIGEPVMVVDGFRYIENDGVQLVRWSALLLSLTILIFFRSLRWVVLPLAVVAITLSVTRGILVSIGMTLSMVSSMLTAVVTVIAVATVVHIIVRFREYQRQGLTAIEAAEKALRELVVPILWASLTDAVAFLSLLIAHVGPVQDYGLMMSIGATLVFVTTVLVSPAIMLIGQPLSPHKVRKTTWVGSQLEWSLEWTLRNSTWLGVVLIALTCFALFGLSRLEIETDFSRNFRSDSQIVRAYELVETRLGGAGVCDVVIPAPHPLTAEFLHNVRHLEQRMREDFGPQDVSDNTHRPLTKVLSLADAPLVQTPPNSFGADQIVQGQLNLIRQPIPDFFDALYGADPEQDGQHYLRIMLRARERQSADEKREFIQGLGQLANEHFPEEQPVVTGFFVLLAELVESVLEDQWRTFLLALACISVMMLFAFCDFKLALVALLPNALPILVVTGCMGWISANAWMAIKANIGTAMIAAVSIGLSVDSSIHYIMAFQRSRRHGHSVDDALRMTHRTVGRALVFSSLALIVGFTVLCSSDFLPTVYFGVLVSVAMAGGLLGNMLTLPVMIRMLTRDD